MNGFDIRRLLKPGRPCRRDAETHAVENLGSEECHVMNIEFRDLKNPAQGVAKLSAGHQAQAEHRMIDPKDMKWQDAPPALPPGSQVAVLEGDPRQAGPYTIRVKSPANYKIPPHWHPEDEHVTVISGSVWMGMGDQLDESKATQIPTGGFVLMPAPNPPLRHLQRRSDPPDPRHGPLRNQLHQPFRGSTKEITSPPLTA